MDAGVPAVAGLRTGLAVAAALDAPSGDSARLRQMGACAATVRAPLRAAHAGSAADALDPAASASGPTSFGNSRRWLSEHEAKELLRAARLPVVDGRLVSGEDDAVVAFSELGGPVAIKLSAASLQHKADVGAVAVDLGTEDAVRGAYRRLVALGVEGAGVLVESMAQPGAELLVAARADAVVPCVVVAAGGAWTELLDDAAIVPLPVSPQRAEEAIRRLRAAPLLTGGRGGTELDVGAAARLAAAAGDLIVEDGLELLELNPVVVYEDGAVAVDAVAAAPAAAT
jgi:acetyl-CoA synthetase